MEDLLGNFFTLRPKYNTTVPYSGISVMFLLRSIIKPNADKYLFTSLKTFS